jgi:hypothetical protein
LGLLPLIHLPHIGHDLKVSNYLFKLVPLQVLG